MSAASLAEPSWRVKHFAHEDKGLRPGWGRVRRYPVWYDPRTLDMGRIHLIAGSAEIARRRRLVPPGRLVEAWQDLRIPDRFWVGDEAKALLDATGVPLPAELSLDDDRVPIFYGARLDHIESLPTETSLRARVVSAGGMAVAWITVNAFGERTEYAPQSPSDPIFWPFHAFLVTVYETWRNL